MLHSKRAFALLSALLIFLSAAGAAPSTAPTTEPARFAGEIAAFEKSDAVHAPPRDANLFIGSSSIARWKTLAADFPDAPVLNRGFGGSMIADCTSYVPRIVLPCHPKRIFLYAGDNDLAGGHAPVQVLADVKEFVQAVRAGQPDIPIYFISIKPSPARAKLLDKVKSANALVAAYLAQGQNLQYIDVFTPMLGPDGQPRPELFGPDKLHMNAEGYGVWTKIITPLVNSQSR